MWPLYISQDQNEYPSAQGKKKSEKDFIKQVV